MAIKFVANFSKASNWFMSMKDYDLGISRLPGLEIEKGTRTQLTLDSFGDTFIVKGKNFTYSEGDLTGGTVTGLTFLLKGSNKDSFTLTGLNLSVKQIFDLYEGRNHDKTMSAVEKQFAGADVITFKTSSGVLVGYGGNDTLNAGGTSSTIYGGDGNDTIIGGLRGNDLYGENGRDTFVYKSVLDSVARSYDTIYDFSGRSGDRIDLSAIDASTSESGNQAFTYIGSKEFTGTAGELRVKKSASETFIYADTNGDKTADLVIHLDDPVTVLKGYFFL